MTVVLWRGKTMNIPVRACLRPRPIDRQAVYGEIASRMLRGERFFEDVKDRSAYVFVTGLFPSHLRPTYSAALRQITLPYDRPSSLDGRSGNVILKQEAIRDLQLERHPMVSAVRAKICQGYFIQPSRGPGTRRNFGKIFMFRLGGESGIEGEITINLEGAIKSGW
jgi:hypothetical protein